jgi:ProP effector
MRRQELHPRTALINKTQKNQSKKARADALLWLAANFPAAFDDSLRIRPLKVGIINDILLHADKAAAQGISKSKLREAVFTFTRKRLAYLACLKQREFRIDLYGNEVMEVTAEEAEHAAAKIKKRVEKSVRNGRKLVTEKSSQFILNQLPASYPAKTQIPPENCFPTYPTRTYATHDTPAQPTRTAAVVVRHKTPRQYDPDAVARLKEKLGLSKTLEGKKEAAE